MTAPTLDVEASAERFPVRWSAATPVARAVALICLSGTVLAGCSNLTMPGLPELSIPDNDPAFRTRVYAGGSLGSSRLDPDTRGTVFNVEDDTASTTQLRLGVDVHNMLAVELESAVLGTAGLREAGTEVDYSAASVSALVYGLGGVQMRSRREGWSAYGRLGFGSLSRSSAVLPLDGSSTGVVLGLGAEYGFDNGLGLRAEFTRYDGDAVFAGLGAVYRFGVGPREVIGLVADSIRPVLERERTHVGVDGRGGAVLARGESPPSLGAARPAPVRAMARQVLDDGDGDGVPDAQDLCLGTGAATSVDRDGCGLFDAVLGDVRFKSGSFWLDARARGALDEVAGKMLAFPEVRIEVQAHTDDTGAADLNLSLSSRRAEAVVAYLRSRGVSELQLQGVGLGESRPLASNDSVVGRRTNRRVELVTLTDLPLDVLAGRSLPGSVWHYPLVREAVDALAGRGAPSDDAPPPAVMASRPGTTDDAEPNVAAAMPLPVPASVAQAMPLPAALPAPGRVVGERLNGVVDGLGFDSGSDRIAAGSDASIDRLVERLQRHPAVRVAIMAHTDGTGRSEDNLILSEARARRVIAVLAARGVDASRLDAEGYGDTLPRVQNLTEADRARNRRIEIRVLP